MFKGQVTVGNLGHGMPRHAAELSKLAEKGRFRILPAPRYGCGARLQACRVAIPGDMSLG